MRVSVTDMRAVRLRELERRLVDGSYVVDVDAVAEAVIDVIARARSRSMDRERHAS
jgi:anti-sigma28 factor (negative regulator of flagellin synthesis)